MRNYHSRINVRISSMLLAVSMTLSLSNVMLAASSYQLPNAREPNIKKEDLTQLRAISKGISAIAKHAQQGVVFVSVSKVIKGQPFGTINPFDFFFAPPGTVPDNSPFGQRGGPRGGRAPEQRQEGLGSGFIVDLEKGYVLTNNHVIDDADEINLKLANGSTHEAKVIGRDKNTDIAVVQIKGKFDRTGLEQLSLADSNSVEVGDISIALGAPFGLEASVSMGVVSALGRGNLSITDLGNFIQTDAAINPGNSGGPLLDTSGMVIGINTAIFSRSGAYNGIGFSIPSNLVRQIANQLISSGKVARGYIGVTLAPLDTDLARELNIPREFRGSLVRSVEPDGPAAKAGIEAGDVVVRVNDKKINDSDHLRSEIGLNSPGASVRLTVYREGKPRDFNVKLGDYNDAVASIQDRSSIQENDTYGIGLTNLTPALKKQYKLTNSKGVLITEVASNSPADRVGLQAGDLIVRVNKTNVTSVKEFNNAVSGKRRVLLRIERQGQNMIVPLDR